MKRPAIFRFIVDIASSSLRVGEQAVALVHQLHREQGARPHPGCPYGIRRSAGGAQEFPNLSSQSKKPDTDKPTGGGVQAPSAPAKSFSFEHLQGHCFVAAILMTTAKASLALSYSYQQTSTEPEDLLDTTSCSYDRLSESDRPGAAPAPHNVSPGTLFKGRRYCSQVAAASLVRLTLKPQARIRLES